MSKKKEAHKWALTYTKNQSSFVYAVLFCKEPKRTTLYKELKEVFDMGFIEAFECKRLQTPKDYEIH